MKPIRNTIVFGLSSGMGVVLALALCPQIWGWPMALKMILTITLVGYTLLLCSWSDTRWIRIFYPLLLVMGAALWPAGLLGFLLIGLSVLSWIRSGICYPEPLLRTLAGEVIVITGGAVFLLLWPPLSALAAGLACWLFFLVQSLYFFFLPDASGQDTKQNPPDSFEQISREMERLIADQDVAAR